MFNHALVATLAALKKGREVLVSDYCNEEPRLYKPMFLYKPSSCSMEIEISRYVFGWLNMHPSYYHSTVEAPPSNGLAKIDSGTVLFIETYRKLCEKFIVGENSSHTARSVLLEKSINDSISYLDNLLSINNKSDNHLERLRYQGEKSRYLFNKTMSELKARNKNECF